MAEFKGRIDVDLAEKFLANHDDSYTGKEDADAAHALRPRGRREGRCSRVGRGPYYPGGAVTGKVTDSDMAAKSFLDRPRRASLRRRFHCGAVLRSASGVRLPQADSQGHEGWSVDEVFSGR